METVVLGRANKVKHVFSQSESHVANRHKPDFLLEIMKISMSNVTFYNR